MAGKGIRAALALAASFVVALAACGARTGLPAFAVDEAGLSDGGAVRDATVDRGSDATIDVGGPDVILFARCDAGASDVADVVDAGPCVGLACRVPMCAKGEGTTVSGRVFAPNGTLPLYNVQVFIPNAPLEPFPRGVQCEQCGDTISGDPITTTQSDPTGRFTLSGVPAGPGIPIVVQLGKWRRQTTLPSVNPCVSNELTDPNLTRLPRNQSEGSLPHVALTTGGCDSLGCMLPKVGIDAAEFGYEADGYDKAINIYNGDESLLKDFGDFTALPATNAMNLWGNATTLGAYDMAIFSCECSEAHGSKGGGYGAAPFGVVTDYLNAGGRIFTTDFQYVWYRYSPDPALGAASASQLDDTGIGIIKGTAPTEGGPLSLVTSFPKGAALATWLETVFPDDPYATKGEVDPEYVFGNIESLEGSKAVTWATSPDSESRASGPRIFTVDTPVGVPATKQCGRGVHIDAHVDPPTTSNVVACNGKTCYPDTCSASLQPDEAMFAFFFFDLAVCAGACE